MYQSGITKLSCDLKLYMGMICLLLVLACVQGKADAEEMDGWIGKEYTSYDSLFAFEAESLGEVQFLPLEKRVPYDQLSNLDKRVIAGAVSEDGSRKRRPWISGILSMAMYYYMERGYLPQTVSVEDIASLKKFSTGYLPESYFEKYRNPYTGAWPRLNATENSRGDMYLKVLTKAEKIFLSNQFPHFRKSFFLDLPEGVEIEDQVVIYYRIYGDKGTMLTALFYPTGETTALLKEQN